MKHHAFTMTFYVVLYKTLTLIAEGRVYSIVGVGGTLRKSEMGHVVCEVRQFYDASGFKFNYDANAMTMTSQEKLNLCTELAKWCLRNSM